MAHTRQYNACGAGRAQRLIEACWGGSLIALSLSLFPPTSAKRES